MKKLIMILFFFQLQFSVSQEILYVSAENGLIVRSGPDKKYDKVGKLEFAEKISSYLSVNRFDEITDDNTVIKGEWYLIRTKYIEEGYVLVDF